jgi:hypothetical protein
VANIGGFDKKRLKKAQKGSKRLKKIFFTEG